MATGASATITVRAVALFRVLGPRHTRSTAERGPGSREGCNSKASRRSESRQLVVDRFGVRTIIKLRMTGCRRLLNGFAWCRSCSVR